MHGDIDNKLAQMRAASENNSAAITSAISCGISLALTDFFSARSKPQLHELIDFYLAGVAGYAFQIYSKACDGDIQSIDEDTAGKVHKMLTNRLEEIRDQILESTKK